LSAAPEPHGEVESLLAAAKRDSLAFNLLAAQPKAPKEVMFFLAQQSIEKTIKAVLAHRKNDQWRLCFRWAAEGAYDVEIADYH